MSTKKGKYGNPRNRKPAKLDPPGVGPSIFGNRSFGDLMNNRQPNGLADPRSLGGSMVDLGGSSRDKNAVIVDTTDVVLLASSYVTQLEIARQGAWDGRVTYLQLEGRVNKTDREVSVGFIMGSDGVAALITELLAIADRDGGETLDDITRRLTELHQGKHVDLTWLRAAIDNAIQLQEETKAE